MLVNTISCIQTTEKMEGGQGTIETFFNQSLEHSLFYIILYYYYSMIQKLFSANKKAKTMEELTADGDCSHEIKRAYSLEGKL